MRHPKTQPLDIIAELRLRLWARNNYVPPAQRHDDDWHPVVLDEMQRKDQDLQESVTESELCASGIVPLLPTFPEGSRVDGLHDSIPAPELLTCPDSAPAHLPYYL